MAKTRVAGISVTVFLPLYVAAVAAGKTAKQIAAELFNVPVEKVTDKQINSVSQRATNARAAIREKHPELTDEQILELVPKLQRTGSATNFLDELVQNLKKTQEPTEQPETPPESKVE